MDILRLTQSDDMQSNALARKLRVKIMSRVGTIEIPQKRQPTGIEIPEILEELLDSLISSLSDKVNVFEG